MTAEPTSQRSQWDREAPGAEPARRFSVGAAAMLLAAGSGLGFLGGFLQAVSISIGGFAVPVGLVLVAATLVAVLRATIHTFLTRWAGVMVLLGWVATSVALALPGPGGDVVIAANTVAMVYLFGGVVVGTACVNVPARLRPPEAAAGGAA